MKNILSALTTRSTTKSMPAISISSAILVVGALAATLVVEQAYALRIMPPGHHTIAYIAGYKMGCTDGPDQENFWIRRGSLSYESFRIGV
jgi:hypothetical protein